jgi:hypothetical protein
LVLTGLCSCVIETLDDPGNPITFNIETADFNSLQVKSIFDIVLVQDSGNYITFECYSNQRKNISTTNQNGLLALNQNIQPSMLGNYKHVKAYIHFKNINAINLGNCVKLENTGIINQSALVIYDGSELSEINLDVNLGNLTISNNSDNLSYYKFTGKSTNVAINMNGSSILKASTLESDYCSIEQGSIGDCYVYVLQKLNVKFLEQGNVYLKGNAEISVDPNGLHKTVQAITGN